MRARASRRELVHWFVFVVSLAATMDARGLEPRCPKSAPRPGTSCPASLTCTWGNHPAATCRTRGACVGERWVVTPAPDACAHRPAACPSSVPNGACESSGALCIYADGSSCACTVCCDAPGCAFPCAGQPQGTGRWNCAHPPRLADSCPRLLPNEGTRCSLPAGTACLTTECGLNVTCDAATWRWNFRSDGCPHPGVGPGGVPAVCASPDLPIDTPFGPRPIAALRPGEIVYSLDHGTRTPVVVARVAHVDVRNHHVVRLRLENGAVLVLSPGHPLANGALVGGVRPGDVLGGQRVQSADLVPYERSATYDMLPASDSGVYFSGGVPLRSTLFPASP